MFSFTIKSLTSKLDLQLMGSVSIFLGSTLLVFGYLSNPYLISILRSNLGLGSHAVLGETSIPRLPIPEPLPDPVSPDLTDSKHLNFCHYLPKDKLVTQENNDYLALLTPNIGFKTIPEYDDLVYLRELGIDSYEFTRLRREPAEQLVLMFEEMQKQGLKPFISSGYRMYSDQIRNIANWNSWVGAADSSRFVALPGHSEHHLGTTVDILTYENGLLLEPSYSRTKLYKWLKQEAGNYGFIASYPDGSENITGYGYEPWHYRYIGSELALKLTSENILLQDYLYSLNSYCLVE